MLQRDQCKKNTDKLSARNGCACDRTWYLTSPCHSQCQIYYPFIEFTIIYAIFVYLVPCIEI